MKAWKYLKYCIIRSFFPISFLLYHLGYRILNINTKRIGHLCMDVDSFIKESILIGRDYKKAILLCPKSHVANSYVAQIYKHKLLIIESNYLCVILKIASMNKIVLEDCYKYSETLGSGRAYLIQRKWEEKKLPLLHTLPSEVITYGRKFQSSIGIPEDAWWVCVHSRESGYSGGEDFGQAYRNSDIESYKLAIEEVINRGGWCVRMGDSSMCPIQCDGNIFDYASYTKKNKALDMYFAAKSHLFLGNTSGAFMLASLFGVPVANANMVPISATFPYGKYDLGIPKLYRHKESGRTLSFNEMFSSDLASARLDKIYKNSENEVINNSSEEILDLLKEQLDRIAGVFNETTEDIEMQLYFRSFFVEGHHSIHSSSRIATTFLRRHKNLISAESIS
jgi:putative glycosyltransferase (TIGR04372 family)